MRTFKNNPSVGVFGEVWADRTCDLIKRAQVCCHAHVFKYTEREALFFDQCEFFIITDFGKDPTSGWNQDRLIKLNQMREIICTRSMRTIMFANDDDADVSTSLREACCRVVRVRNTEWSNIPSQFASLVCAELPALSLSAA